MCCYRLKGSLPIRDILWFCDSVHCSALRGESGPASCHRRALRHKVIALTQEESILQSWVQFCIWLSQWLGMTALSVESWRLEGAGHHPAVPQSAGDGQPNDMNLLQSRHDMLHGNLFPAVYIWAKFCLSHLSLLVSFTYYRTKKYLVVPLVGKLNLHVNMVTLTSSYSPPLSNKKLNRIRWSKGVHHLISLTDTPGEICRGGRVSTLPICFTGAVGSYQEKVCRADYGVIATALHPLCIITNFLQGEQ